MLVAAFSFFLPDPVAFLNLIRQVPFHRDRTSTIEHRRLAVSDWQLALVVRFDRITTQSLGSQTAFSEERLREICSGTNERRWPPFLASTVAEVEKKLLGR